ncbi:MAG TPA: phosphatase domain-containing protein [Chitinophagaceae bacterium]|jgi:phosphatidate phosphatase APP1
MLSKTPVIWQLSVIQFEHGTLIEGVALAEIYSSTSPGQFFAHQATSIIRSYTNKPYSGSEIFITVNKKLYTLTTGIRGGFNFWLKEERVDNIEIYVDALCQKIIPTLQLYPVYFLFEGQQMEIISDIDDTIFQSFTNSFLRRVFTILFKKPSARKMVPFTKDLLIYARESRIRVYCISRSEGNLFPLLANMLTLNNITNAVIHLFDYLNLRGLFTARKKRFKFECISYILQNSPGKLYCLVGDDTQDDIRIYCEIAEQFPGKICTVLIHKTRVYFSRLQKYYHERLVSLNISVMYFDAMTLFDQDILKNINH